MTAKESKAANANVDELTDSELEQISGGVSLDPAAETSWKMASLDGKGNDVLTEEIIVKKTGLEWPSKWKPAEFLKFPKSW